MFWGHFCAYLKQPSILTVLHWLVLGRLLSSDLCVHLQPDDLPWQLNNSFKGSAAQTQNRFSPPRCFIFRCSHAWLMAVYQPGATKAAQLPRDFHIPVWQWMQSGGGAACAGCSLCRWSRRRPAGGGPPGSPSPWRLSSCRRRGRHRPPQAKTPGWASFCPQIWSKTLPLVRKRGRGKRSFISSDRAALITFH